jgi:hypothetical protein
MAADYMLGDTWIWRLPLITWSMVQPASAARRRGESRGPCAQTRAGQYQSVTIRQYLRGRSNRIYAPYLIGVLVLAPGFQFLGLTHSQKQWVVPGLALVFLLCENRAAEAFKKTPCPKCGVELGAAAPQAIRYRTPPINNCPHCHVRFDAYMPSDWK